MNHVPGIKKMKGYVLIFFSFYQGLYALYSSGFLI